MIGLEGKMLSSQRLTYRLLNQSDYDALRAILSDGTVTEPAGFLPPVADGDYDAFFRGVTQGNTGVAILSGDQLIGYVRVHRENMDSGEFEGKNCVGLGFVIGKAYHNHGYGTEMLIWITGYLKERVDYCFADAFVDNIPSQRVIQKAGYRYVEDYSMYFEALGKEMTCHSYVY